MPNVARFSSLPLAPYRLANPQHCNPIHHPITRPLCALFRPKSTKLVQSDVAQFSVAPDLRSDLQPSIHLKAMLLFAKKIFLATPTALVVLLHSLLNTSLAQLQPPPTSPTETPLNQTITPAGHLIPLPGMRPQVLTLSPDSKWLLTSGKTNKLVIINAENHQVAQSVDFPSKDQTSPPTSVSPNILTPDNTALVSYTGLVCDPTTRQTFVSNVAGSIKVFSTSEEGVWSASHTIPLPDAKAPRRSQEIPSGLAIDDAQRKLYVCGNLSNTLIEINLADNQVLRQIPVGVAPYDVVLHDNKAYVSNWGGRVPQTQDLTGPAGRGTLVRVDPVRHIANEGTVSIIDLTTGNTKHCIVGLGPSDLVVSPDGKHIVCANTNSDSLSILSTQTDTVIDTIPVNAKPSDLYGAAPNALAFNAKGDTLYVANGSQNAIGVISFDAEYRGSPKLRGLIPVGWFPGAIAFDAKRDRICSANLKGLPTQAKKNGNGMGFNSHQHHGSVSIVPIPNEEQLAVLSELAANNMRRPAMHDAALPARPDQPPLAIPQRIGEPSLIEHVVYVIKENRTYDQVLGDIERGNGNKDLCIFGQNVTPNQHRLAEQFVLLDNTYCCGILSADGHNWSTSALSNAYLEKSFAGFPRSYPDGMGDDEADALAYSPAGFLWDNAVLHKKTIRNYGEFMKPNLQWRDRTKKGRPDYMSCFRTWKGADEVAFACEPTIESIRPYSPSQYVGWAMEVPDQFRADYIIRELAEFEKQGTFPNLTIICLPNDHTSGTSPKFPTPASSMADNDLAFGRIVEALSHSQFWPKMAIFGIEDDPQAGWDHVSGYRTTAYCISPYAHRNRTVSTRYNTTSILRTIEQILGLPPMNQFDAAATPMFDCFHDTPDLTPFDAVPSLVALDELNPPLAAIQDAARRAFAESSTSINFREIDKAPEDLLNRILWNAMQGDQPYPEWATSPADDDDSDDESGDEEDSDDQAGDQEMRHADDR
jgi:YVTN family beta-propeller protein